MPVPTPSWAVRNGLNAEFLDADGKNPADAVTYDNGSSGLTATDVQAAIDELAAAGPGGGGTSLLGFYNVQDYGAVGDGTTDDTSAIEDTFDAADATGGGVIYFPPTADFYKITSLISRTGTSKYHLLGGSTRYGPARVHQVTANTGAFKFAPASGTANRDKAPLIESLTITGAGGASSGRGIEGTNDLHVRDCFVAGFFDGIYIGGASYYNFVSDTTITDCDNAAIHLVDTNNTTIERCRITGQWGAGTGLFGTLKHGIVGSFGSPTGITTRIVNCSIEYFTDDGIVVDGGYAVEIVGNYFETQQSSSGHAHVKIGPGSNVCYATRIESNWFQGDGTSGFDAIALDRANGVVIGANAFGINSAIGISSTGNTSSVLAWNNRNNPAGTFSFPSGSRYTLDPANPPITTGDAAGGDLAGTYPNPTVQDDSHSHTAATLPAGSSGGHILLADGRSTPFAFNDLLQADDGSDFLWTD